MPTHRSLLRAVAAAFGAALLAACADAPTAPAMSAVATRASYSAAETWGAPTGNTVVTVFTVDPGRRSAHMVGGLHFIVFEGGTICDPATSSYGPGEWNQPCPALTRPIQITARSHHDAQGSPHVDFQPELRFWSSRGRAVTLYLYDPREAAAWGNILYCPDGGPCVDEAAADPTLYTTYERQGKYLFRQIKHFSGYNVSLGFADAF